MVDGFEGDIKPGRRRATPPTKPSTMTMTSHNQTTADAALAQPGQENLTTQIQHKVDELGGKMQDLKETAAETLSPPEEKPEDEKTAGEKLDSAVESTKTKVESTRDAIGEKVHEAIVEPVGEKIVQAGDALKDQSEAVAPKEEKTMLEKVKGKLDSAKESIKEGFNSLTGKKNEEEAPKTIGGKIDSAISAVTGKVEEAKESANTTSKDTEDTANSKIEESKQFVADQLSKAGDALKSAGDKAQNGERK
mmetsp:Transcript_21441/g.52893  ORF Transcript_21441/g.52893 Transcript_21441/m.52893 type:complete len:250 (-) Transcript_21441:171-920(-)